MEAIDSSFLRSLRNEAGRQADFFTRRDPETATTWRSIESLAHQCLISGAALRLLVVPSSESTSIIKPCE